jgi:atypical dual specificity phosphatase
VDGFSWIIEKKLAGMPRPRGREPDGGDFGFLAKNGIRLLVTLTEQSPNADALARFDIASIHIPVRDFGAPSVAQLQQFVAEAGVANARGHAVGVHCGAGLGRTGTFLAAYLIAQGLKPKEAIAKVRKLRPASIETADQEAILFEFAVAELEERPSPETGGASIR